MYKSLFENNEIVFEDYNDVLNYIKFKSKEYGNRNKFLSSEEYKKIYPYIKKLYDIEKQKSKQTAKEAMNSVNIDFGDKVEYSYVSPFLTSEHYTGIVINRNGIPYVKYDKGKIDMKGRKSSRWHKGWKKIK